MNIRKILKELEKEKDKLSYLKKLLEKIKDKKLKSQIQQLINYLEKKEEKNLEERLTNIPIPRREVMQSLRQEALEAEPEYKERISAAPRQIIPQRTPEDLEKNNIYKKGSSESYHSNQERNPIKARMTESYEVNHLESTISSEAKQNVASKLKGTMSEDQMVKYTTEMEDKAPKYTTGVSHLEEKETFNISTNKKKKIHEDYK